MLGGFLSLMLIQFTFAEQGTVLCSKRMYKLRQWIYFVATYAAVQRKSGSDDPLFCFVSCCGTWNRPCFISEKENGGEYTPRLRWPQSIMLKPKSPCAFIYAEFMIMSTKSLIIIQETANVSTSLRLS